MTFCDLLQRSLELEATDKWDYYFTEFLKALLWPVISFLICFAAPHQRLEPVTLPGIVSFVLSLLCGALNLIRGFHAIESLLQVLHMFMNLKVTHHSNHNFCFRRCCMSWVILFQKYCSWGQASVTKPLWFVICACSLSVLPHSSRLWVSTAVEGGWPAPSLVPWQQWGCEHNVLFSKFVPGYEAFNFYRCYLKEWND